MLARLRQWLLGTVRRRLIVSVVLVHAVMMGAFIWDLNLRQRNLLLAQQQ